MKGSIENVGKAFSFVVLGFVIGVFFGSNVMGQRYQNAMQEVDRSFRAALGWQAPRDLKTCRDMLTAIVLSDPTVLDLSPKKTSVAD